MQVLSHANPGLQKLDADTAVSLARGANDRLHEAVRAHPDRFAAFAAIPTPEPKAAADELERTVTKLGFKGALVNGLTNGLFLDDKRFWPIFERAQALDVPLYLHPGIPPESVRKAYYQGLPPKVEVIFGAPGWGWHAETAVHVLRLVVDDPQILEEQPHRGGGAEVARVRRPRAGVRFRGSVHGSGEKARVQGGRSARDPL